MNNHKLKKLMQSPNKEGMRQHLKENGQFWDYKDKRCRYHSRAYGKAHKMVQYKYLNKKIETNYDKAVKKLKSKPEYKYQYWFREAVDSVLKDVRSCDLNWRGEYYCPYFVDKEGLLRLHSGKKRLERRRHTWTSRTGKQTIFKYASGLVIELRNGIHYFLVKEGYYEDVFRKVLGKCIVSHERVNDVYQQLNTKQLKLFGLENEHQD